MTVRGIVAILLSVVVVLEILVFLGLPTPTVHSGNTLFGRTVDHDAQANQNMRFALVIGATILIGAIVSFAMPSTRLTKESSKRLKKWAIGIIVFIVIWVGFPTFLEYVSAGQEMSKYNGLIGFGLGIIVLIVVLTRDDSPKHKVESEQLEEES